jgi:hypothetical protein
MIEPEPSHLSGSSTGLKWAELLSGKSEVVIEIGERLWSRSDARSNRRPIGRDRTMLCVVFPFFRARPYAMSSRSYAPTMAHTFDVSECPGGGAHDCALSRRNVGGSAIELIRGNIEDDNISMRPLATRRRFIVQILGAAAACCRAAEASLPVTRTRTRLAVVPVFVGKTRLNFVADTGAANSLIALEALPRLHPADFEFRGVVTQTFAGGQATTQRIALRSVAVTPGQGTAIDVNGIAMSPLRDQFGADVDGVLGMEILCRYTLRLDFRRQRIDLLPQTASLGDKGVPFDFNAERKIVFPAQLDGRRVTALLDTGAVQTGVNWRAAIQLGINRETPGLSEKWTLVGGDRNVWTIHQYQFSKMQIGSMQWEQPILVIADIAAFAALGLSMVPSAIVGMDLLDNRITTISFTQRRLTIQ